MVAQHRADGGAVPAAVPSRCPFGFSSKYLDTGSGLLYFGHRTYSVDLGRWLCRDPLGEKGGANLYATCQNDPVNAVDPLGLEIAVFLPPANTIDKAEQHIITYWQVAQTITELEIRRYDAKNERDIGRLQRGIERRQEDPEEVLGSNRLSAAKRRAKARRLRERIARMELDLDEIERERPEPIVLTNVGSLAESQAAINELIGRAENDRPLAVIFEEHGKRGRQYVGSVGEGAWALSLDAEGLAANRLPDIRTKEEGCVVFIMGCHTCGSGSFRNEARDTFDVPVAGYTGLSPIRAGDTERNDYTEVRLPPGCSFVVTPEDATIPNQVRRWLVER